MSARIRWNARAHWYDGMSICRSKKSTQPEAIPWCFLAKIFVRAWKASYFPCAPANDQSAWWSR